MRRTFASGRLLLTLAALAPLSCGARTGLRDEPPPIDASRDAPDAPPPECRVDAQCDDGIACTRDRCDVAAGRCVRTPDDAPCDDRRFCNGVERCAVGVGCTAGAPPACADAVACTRDACDDATQRCAAAPDDAMCPISHRCDLTRGCVARALAVTSTNLYEVELPSAALRAIGPVRPFTDVALHPDRTLYAVTLTGELWRIDPTTARSTFDFATGVELTALDAAPDGTLYAAGPRGLYRIDRATASAVFVAAFPMGYEASGDIAVLQGRLLATARTGPSALDVLVEFDVAAGASRVIGDVGYSCVYALAAFGPTLYGMSCQGYVIEINAATGAPRRITRNTVTFYGATAR